MGWSKKFFLALLCAVPILGTATLSQKEAVLTAASFRGMSVVPCGTPIGVSLESDGIMVLGTGFVTGEDDVVYEPAKSILSPGDTILSVDGKRVTDKEDILQAVEESSGKALSISLLRKGVERTASLTPVKSKSGGYKIGAWIRDSAQGIGTLTYYVPSSGAFGALGHGVYDVDTKSLISLKSGKVYPSSVTGVKKGESGSPGEILGEIDKDSTIGTIEKNTEYGLYGTTEERSALPSATVEVAGKEEVHTGDAVVRTSIVGGEPADYAISIEKVNPDSKNADKGMTIRITDETLLSATGGIVQGMSGSPILQDGKIVGAVTHVFVQDPARGYGIFIESMLSQNF